MKDLRTIVLAAGKGTRMRSAFPKVLHKVCGKAMLHYVLDAAKTAGTDKICLVLGHGQQAVKDQIGDGYDIVIQEKLLGTGDAVKVAQAKFRGYQGDILILCGDTPLLRKESLKALVRKHRRSGAECTILTSVLSDPEGYGRIIRDDSGKVVDIREEKDASEFEKDISEINTGVYCFKGDALFGAVADIKVNAKKKEFYLTDVVALLNKDKSKIETVESSRPEEGEGVNSRADLAFAEAVIRYRILNDLMLQGVTITDPGTTYIHADVRIKKDTVIHPFTVIEENVLVGANSTIGPFAHLRPGTRIADSVQVGNFAEISRSQIGAGSIMKHFGFLGDAQVGKNVNIGAGVVTANYDGVNKSKTMIGDGAFIGSDSILVAPVKIGVQAMTGAGCVVTKGKVVPNNHMALGVPAKIISRKQPRRTA